MAHGAQEYAHELPQPADRLVLAGRGREPRTQLLADAEERGCTVLDGLGMLVNQGVISIRHWTGVDADPTVMRREVERLFGLLDLPDE